MFCFTKLLWILWYACFFPLMHSTISYIHSRKTHLFCKDNWVLWKANQKTTDFVLSIFNPNSELSFCWGKGAGLHVGENGRPLTNSQCGIPSWCLDSTTLPRATRFTMSSNLYITPGKHVQGNLSILNYTDLSLLLNAKMKWKMKSIFSFQDIVKILFQTDVRKKIYKECLNLSKRYPNRSKKSET